MKHFTVSSKGRKGYLFATHALRYELTVDINGTFTDFDIYANNRQAAIVSATIIVESDNIQSAVDIQNAKQQIIVANGLLINNTTEYTVEQITDYINRINAKYGFTTVINEVVQPATTINNVNNDNVIVESTKTIEATPDQSFTAYNRSFSTYNEAHTYCIESDFDPSYIVTEEPITAVQSTTTKQPDIFQQSEQIRDYINANGWKWNDYKTLSDVTGQTEEICKKIFGIYNIIPELRSLLQNEVNKKGLTLLDKLDSLQYLSQLSEEKQNELVIQTSAKKKEIAS